MRFRCSRTRLYEALSLLSSIVPARSTKPILQNIRLEGTEAGELELAATDLEVGLRYTLEVEEMSEPEAVVLPSQRLNNIIRDAWGEEVTVEVAGAKGTIETQGASFNIAGESAAEFPEIPALDADHAVELRADDLQTAIGQTLFATAREEQQYSLAGVHIGFEKKQLEMVTTDTFRLALARRPLRTAVEEPANAIVLAKGMHELQRLLPGEELVRLQIDESQFFAATSRATLVSRLIEGKFPQYRNVIPKDLDKKITVDRTRFTEALRQAAHVANQETRAVSLVAHDEVLEVNAASAQGDEAHIEIEAAVEGGEVSVSFSYSYLLDVLKVLDEEQVTLQVRDRESAARLDVKDYTYVVSPICPRTGT
jgi:DNA polymerase-3 subunit beta